MQAYIKYKAYYDQITNASKVKGRDCVCVFQPEVEYQGSKNPFREFWWVGPYIVEEICPITSKWYAKLEQGRPKCFIA